MAGKNSKGGTSNTKVKATFGGTKVPVDQIIGSMPEDFRGFPQTEEGIEFYLLRGGLPADQINKYMTDENGATEMLSFLSSGWKHPRPLPIPGAREAASRGGNANPGGDAGGDKPAKKTRGYPKPVDAAPSENFEASLGAAVDAAKDGGERGGPLHTLEVERKPDGGYVQKFTYFERSPDGTAHAVGTQTVDQDGTVVDQTGNVPDNSSQTDNQANDKSWANWANPKNRPTIGERYEKRAEAVRKAGQNVEPISLGITTGLQHAASGAAAAGYRNLPALTTTGVGLGALYGGYRLLGSGTTEPPQPQGSAVPEHMRSQFDDIWDRASGAAPSSPPAQPVPDTSGTSAPNPAGTPSNNNTTLMQLQRLMKSREYA
jgi:hypothetical protein